jgi:hypothetical protein
MGVTILWGNNQTFYMPEIRDYLNGSRNWYNVSLVVDYVGLDLFPN